MALDPELSAKLTRNADGLFAAIAQERGTGIVLMMAWMDDTALERTLESRRATYYSRSRQQYWVKGETSGHFQHVHDVRIDCDGDTLLLIVDRTVRPVTRAATAASTPRHCCPKSPHHNRRTHQRAEEQTMPLIQISQTPGMSDRIKRETIAAVTEAYARATGKNPDSVWVTINEIPRTQWGVGGEPLG